VVSIVDGLRIGSGLKAQGSGLRAQGSGKSLLTKQHLVGGSVLFVTACSSLSPEP